MSEPVVIQDRVFGIGEPTILIAEISANHDRDINQALALVDIVAEAGWDCVKFQTYDAETLTIRSSHASMKVDPIGGQILSMICINWQRCQWNFTIHFLNAQKRKTCCRLQPFMIPKTWNLLKNWVPQFTNCFFRINI